MPISWQDQFGEIFIDPILRTSDEMIGYGVGYFFGLEKEAAQAAKMYYDATHQTYDQRKAYAIMSSQVTGSAPSSFNSKPKKNTTRRLTKNTRRPLTKIQYKDYKGSIYG